MVDYDYMNDDDADEDTDGTSITKSPV